MRSFSLCDKVLLEIDTAIRTLFVPENRSTTREHPGLALPEPLLTAQEKKHGAGLMRVNHAGEVCAQALYQGQALTAHLTTVKAQMTEAAAEEVEHLAWCEKRLQELDSQPSVLNTYWYIGSLMICALAGLAGDRWSLGFVAETERQVSNHLKEHLQNLPPQDLKTKEILTVMHEDEAHHADVAKAAGAAELPFVVKQMMKAVSKVLTYGSYYV